MWFIVAISFWNWTISTELFACLLATRQRESPGWTTTVTVGYNTDAVAAACDGVPAIFTTAHTNSVSAVHVRKMCAMRRLRIALIRRQLFWYIGIGLLTKCNGCYTLYTRNREIQAYSEKILELYHKGTRDIR